MKTNTDRLPKVAGFACVALAGLLLAISCGGSKAETVPAGTAAIVPDSPPSASVVQDTFNPSPPAGPVEPAASTTSCSIHAGCIHTGSSDNTVTGSSPDWNFYTIHRSTTSRTSNPAQAWGAGIHRRQRDDTPGRCGSGTGRHRKHCPRLRRTGNGAKKPGRGGYCFRFCRWSIGETG